MSDLRVFLALIGSILTLSTGTALLAYISPGDFMNEGVGTIPPDQDGQSSSTGTEASGDWMQYVQQPAPPQWDSGVGGMPIVAQPFVNPAQNTMQRTFAPTTQGVPTQAPTQTTGDAFFPTGAQPAGVTQTQPVFSQGIPAAPVPVAPRARTAVAAQPSAARSVPSVPSAATVPAPVPSSPTAPVQPSYGAPVPAQTQTTMSPPIQQVAAFSSQPMYAPSATRQIPAASPSLSGMSDSPAAPTSARPAAVPAAVTNGGAPAQQIASVVTIAFDAPALHGAAPATTRLHAGAQSPALPQSGAGDLLIMIVSFVIASSIGRRRMLENA